jgi:hypothetical protein
MKWFKHDSNAHTDDKLQKVLMRHGAEGYALYWYCVELIAARVTPDNITFELKHDAEVLGYHLKIDTRKVEKIMLDMVNLGLFEYSGDNITCMKLAKRLDNTMTQSREIKETLSNFKKLSPDKNRLDKNRLDKNRKEKSKEIATVAQPPRFNFKKSLIELGVQPSTVEAWLSVRKKKRAVDSEVALNGIIREVGLSGISFDRAIQFSAENSYSGFKAEWFLNATAQENSTKKSPILAGLTDRSWAAN